MQRSRSLIVACVTVAVLFVLLFRQYSGSHITEWASSPSLFSSASAASPDPALAAFFPAIHPQDGEERPLQHPLITEGYDNLQALVTCLSRGTCREKQKMIVLIVSWHFFGWIDGSTTGEAIWCGSILDTLRDLGYTLVFAGTHQEGAKLYSLFPDLVKVVLGETAQGRECFADAKCVKSARNALGIPMWKFFQFHLWASVTHPLGGNWTLAIEDTRPFGIPNQYIGYSLEPTCTKRPFVPPRQREHRAFVLGKRISYWTPEYCAANPEALVAASEPPLNLAIVGGSHNDTADDKVQPPPMLKNLGFMTKENFFAEIGKSKAMLGIGNPPISPSPFDALCLGVPFLNPIMRWDTAHPEDRSAWLTQHDGMKYLEPPYVYHYHSKDSAELYKALEQAVQTPIDRFIAPWMKYTEMKKRIVHLVESDWQAEAEVLLQERRVKGEELFVI